MTEAEIGLAVISSVATGGVSTLATVKALGVHITYIRERLSEHNSAIERAHSRLDQAEAELSRCREAIIRLHPGEKV